MDLQVYLACALSVSAKCALGALQLPPHHAQCALLQRLYACRSLPGSRHTMVDHRAWRHDRVETSRRRSHRTARKRAIRRARRRSPQAPAPRTGRLTYPLVRLRVHAQTCSRGGDVTRWESTVILVRDRATPSVRRAQGAAGGRRVVEGVHGQHVRQQACLCTGGRGRHPCKRAAPRSSTR